MAVVDVSHLSYNYGKLKALRDLELSVPEGALYALLGPNGSGKTTLLQILMGLRRAREGRVTLLGTDIAALTMNERRRMCSVAEGQSLPRWMRLEQVEAYSARELPSPSKHGCSVSAAFSSPAPRTYPSASSPRWDPPA